MFEQKAISFLHCFPHHQYINRCSRIIGNFDWTLFCPIWFRFVMILKISITSEMVWGPADLPVRWTEVLQTYQCACLRPSRLTSEMVWDPLDLPVRWSEVLWSWQWRSTWRVRGIRWTGAEYRSSPGPGRQGSEEIRWHEATQGM